METRRPGVNYREVHQNAIVYDAVCPLANEREESIDDWIAGGATVIAPTLGGPTDMPAAMHSISSWYEKLRRRSDELLLVTKAEDMAKAKDEGKLGIIFHFQGTRPIGRDLGLIEVYYKLGVRIMQLTYNVKDFVGDGCEEPGDGGISEFGKRVIQEMNRVGMVVDLSHTGRRTTLEAMDVSTSPCVFSHSNCNSIFRSNRNIDDEQIKAVAAMGGVIGVNFYPNVVSNNKPQSTQGNLLAHVDRLADLAGVEHIGFGGDYFGGQHPYSTLEEAEKTYRGWVDSGLWNPETYPPPPYVYPDGLETPDKLENFTRMLIEHEYSEDEVHKILGANFMRVYQEVWK